MKERLIEKLKNSEYIERKEISKPLLLVYLMGPYKSHPPYEEQHAVYEERDAATSRKALNESLDHLQNNPEDFDHDEALWLLIGLKRELRENMGVNAFLATDPGIDPSEMDAATQSIEYAKASVATIFIAPAMGDNLGVGIEVGSVCEHLADNELKEDLLFLGEQNVDSTMVEAVSERWHVTVDDFEDFDSLYQSIKAHIRDVA